MKILKQLSCMYLFLLCTFSMLACSSEVADKKEQGEGETTKLDNATSIGEVALPEGGIIDLGKVMPDPAGTSLSLDAGTLNYQCPGAKVRTIFGSQLFLGCAVFHNANRALYNTLIPDANGDGSVDCDDETSSSSADSPLLSLLCRSELKTDKKIVSISDAGSNRAASFAAQGSSGAVGFFTAAKDATVYPMDIAFWKGTTGSMRQFINVSFQDQTSYKMVSLHNDYNVPQKTIYRIPKDLTACVTNNESCIFQETQISYENDPALIVPSAALVRSFSDKKTDPDFMLVEGYYIVSAERAAKFMAANQSGDGETLFENGRSVYYQIVAKGNEVWGRMFIRDENGEIVEGYKNFAGQGPLLAKEAGHCVPMRGVKPSEASNENPFELGDCESLNGPSYLSRFVGEEEMKMATSTSIALPAADAKEPADGIIYLE